MAGIKHTKVSVLPDDPAFEVSSGEWNDEHTIDDNSIPLAKISGHSKTAHDALGINAATLEGSTKAQVQDHTPKAHTHPVSELTDHDKTTHDPLAIDADTVDGKHASELGGTEYQIQTDVDFTDPTGAKTNGRVVIVYNSTLDLTRLYWCANTKWFAIEPTITPA